MDSFKSTIDSLKKITEIFDGGYHYYKEAIFSLHHANEILLKDLIKKKTNSDENIYGFDGVIKKFESEYGISIPADLKNKMTIIKRHRNNLMHSTIQIDDTELTNIHLLLKNTLQSSIDFFESQFGIGKIKFALNYARYVYTNKDYEADMNEFEEEWLEQMEKKYDEWLKENYPES